MARLVSKGSRNFSDLRALFFNGTLAKSPDVSHTERLLDISKNIMKKYGVLVEVIRTIDHPDIASGIWPDMREHGWEKDEWPEIYKRVQAADIVVMGGPVWLGGNSSQTRKIIERLYANSYLLNDKGQGVYYGKVGGCVVTGREGGIKHAAMNVVYSLQHMGFTVPPQVDSGWIGEAGPNAMYGEGERGGKLGWSDEFTKRGINFMTWNLMHIARMLKDAGGIAAHGNQRSEWDANTRYDFLNPDDYS